MFAFPLLVLALGAPTPSSPLAGCLAVAIGDTGWQYECGAVHLAVVNDRPDHSPVGSRAFLTGMADGVGDPSPHRETRALGGQPVQVERSAGKHLVIFAAIVDGPQGMRYLACRQADGERWCDAVLERLVAVGWLSGAVPGAIRQAPAALGVRGRPVTVPAGCQGEVLPNGGRVLCNGSEFALWVTAADEAAADTLMTRFAQLANSPAAPGSPAASRQVPCRIAGAPSTCTQLVREMGGGPVEVVWGKSSQNGSPLVVSCVANGRRLGDSPCALVFADP